MPFTNDDLWPDFVPIWKALLDLGAGEMLQIAGGYGLFLKQQWLQENQNISTAVPLERWIDSNPRATSDFDLLLGLEFISDISTNKRIPMILKENGFEVTEKLLGQRWQFVKEVVGGKVILAELHAPTPGPEYKDLLAEKVRVKRKPSLGKDGIHGRHNKEAVGAELFPCLFNLEGVPLAVPNSVTWAVMKLTAMADFWKEANNSDITAEKRTKARKQAEKHAQDACRTIAMMTIEERERTAEVVESIRTTDPFQKAAQIFADAFQIEGWAIDLVQNNWESDDLTIIINVLGLWFAAGHS